MAPRPAKYYAMGVVEARKNISLPDKFQCRDCLKWKDVQVFSNKEQKNYLAAKSEDRHGAITPVTAKLRCRACAGEQVQELQCNGHCGQWKSLDRFSKSQRTRGSGWCQECVLWKETVDCGTVTAAPPNTERAPDEEAATSSTVHGPNGGRSYATASDPYGDEYDSSGDDYTYGYPHAVGSAIPASAFETVPSHAFPTTSQPAATKPTITASNRIPPHLRTGPLGAGSSKATSSAVPGQSVASHNMSTASSLSYPYASASQSAMDRADEDSGWTPVGKRAPSAKPGGQELPFRPAPSSQRAPALAPPVAASRGNWAKAVGTKTQRVPPPKAWGYKKSAYYDSDDERDEM